MIESWAVDFFVFFVGFVVPYAISRNRAGVVRQVAVWVGGVAVAFVALGASFLALVYLAPNDSPAAIAIFVLPPLWFIFVGPSVGLACAAVARYRKIKQVGAN